MNNRPLVSIIIVTYNSSQYVIETLDSAISQTYRNIEIIISDDYSSDNTIDICNHWIATHHHIDINITLLKSEFNTGVSGNCNRGLHAACGEWIKIIAGDDILKPSAIEDYINFITKHPNTRHLIADLQRFKGSSKDCNYLDFTPLSRYLYRHEVSAKWQYSIITKTFFGSGPTYFIHADTLKKIGGFDERFPMQEDYPLFIKMIKNGYKMEYLDKITVYYRVLEHSISHARDKDSIFSKNQRRMILEYKYLYRAESLNLLWRLFHYYSLGIQTLIIKFGNTKNRPICFLLKLLYSVTDPFVWFARYIKFKENHYMNFNV